MPRDTAPTGRRAAALAALALLGCARARPAAPAPADAVAARFAVAETRRAGPACELTLHATGTAYPRGGQLEVVVPRASIAVTRVNDKQRDDLHLAVAVGGPPPAGERLPLLLGEAPAVVLRPTVDSAGPELTTWTASDTLHLLVPWRRALAPRWLYFRAVYTTVGYAGALTACGAMLHSDTLRFAPVRAP